MLASSSWLGWLASLILDEADEKGRWRLHGEAAGRSNASNSAGTLVEEANEDLSPAVHQPPSPFQAPERRFGLYRGGPRNGTEIAPYPKTNVNSTDK